jgi:hypothetical protein
MGFEWGLLSMEAFLVLGGRSGGREVMAGPRKSLELSKTVEGALAQMHGVLTHPPKEPFGPALLRSLTLSLRQAGKRVEEVHWR